MTNNSNMAEMNKFENFDAIYMRELELQRELEKVEVVYAKTVEKYDEYEDLKYFAEYLRVVEKLFMEDKFRNHGFEQCKDEMIKLKIKLLAKNGPIGEEVLNAIYSYFKKTSQTVDRIQKTASELLEKYKDDPECMDFISYVKGIFVNFFNAEQEHISMDELKSRLIKERMEALSSTGDPALETLEKIYSEFNDLLNK